MEPVQEFLSRIFIPKVDFGFVWKAYEWLRNRFCRQEVTVLAFAIAAFSFLLICFDFKSIFAFILQRDLF